MSLTNKTEILHEHNIHTKTIKTYTVAQEHTCKWTLNNVSELPITVPIVTSPFCLEPDVEWHFEIKRNGSTCFYLHRHADKPNLNVEYTIIASSLDDKEICRKTSTIVYTKEHKCYDLLPNVSINKYNFILFTVNLKLILPEITVKYETTTPEEFKRQTLSTLAKDYKGLYISKNYIDCKLRVDKQETLSVHKVILSARSPVFERMFKHEDTVENQGNIVDIDDISMSALKHLVAFLYSGELLDYDFETAMEVYYAADKYVVMELRQHCCHRVVSNLTRLNVCRAIILAEQHDDKALRDGICNFILLHHDQGQ